MPKVSLIMGSESDRELGEKAESILKSFNVEYDIEIISAHRSPRALQEYIEESDVEVFIAIAGLSAAIPGFIAAHTIRPVIGVPRDVKLGGLDSLLSMVQMPTGVPVATVGIDRASNGALLACEILALQNQELASKLMDYRFKRAARPRKHH